MRNLTQNPVKDVESAEDCQAACATTHGCRYFSWERALENCWLADATMKTFSQEAAFVAGTGECAGPSTLCSAVPGPGFPGATAADSDDAWPTGFVPPKLQCWPRDEDGKFVPCEQEMTVLDDSAAGWPGKCLGLDPAPDENDGTSCEEQCRAADDCSVWQQVTDDDGSQHCWIGFGSDCFHSERKAHITAAQRILRGSFRVLMDLQGFEVGEGYLKKAFDALPAGSHGFGQSVDEAVRQCNHTCLSLLTCELWQYSTQIGCQINDPKFKALPYPLTTTAVREGTPRAGAVIAGAYIQRLCMSVPDIEGSKPAAKTAGEGSKPAATTKLTTTTTKVTATGTSTTGPSTSSVTSLTTILPVKPLEGEPDLFIRGAQATELYFRDGETSTKHLVRFDLCAQCPKKVEELCGRPMQVTEGEILGLETGEDFECDMFNHGEARPVEDQMETVSPQPGQETVSPQLGQEQDKPDESSMTTLPDRSTTATTTKPLATAGGTTAEHAALPWWLWVLLVAGLLGIFGCVAFLAMRKRRGYSPPRTRAAKLAKGAPGATGSTADHDKSFSLSSSFDGEAAAPLMASRSDGQAMTTLARPTRPGETRLDVASPEAFTVGDVVSITGGGNSETRTIAGFGSIVVDQPLAYGYPVGAVIAKQGACVPGAATRQALGSRMGQPLKQTQAAPQTQMLSPATQAQMLTQDLDLVTVTPQGLAVTPLNGNPPPPGIPMLQENHQVQGLASLQTAGAPPPLGMPQQASSPAALSQAGMRQDMDLVTVTPQGLAVTPLNGHMPPAGVPFLGPGGTPCVPGYGHMPTGIQAPQLPTGPWGTPGVPAWPQPLR